MKLIEYITKLEEQKTLSEGIVEYFLKKNIDEEVPSAVVDFIKIIATPASTLTSEHVLQFLNYIQNHTISPTMRELLGYIFIEQGMQLLEACKPEIELLRKRLKNAIEQERYNPNGFQDVQIQHAEVYKRFVVIHQLYKNFSIDSLVSKIKISDYQDSLYYQIPYALNVLLLTGHLPLLQDNPFKIKYDQPFQETTRDTLEEKNLPRGIKDVNRFYKFERVIKMTGSNITNGTALTFDRKQNKLLYVRIKPNRTFTVDFGYESYSAEMDLKNNQMGIFASKIARRVSKKHFSSERLISNFDTGSRALPGYKKSIMVVDEDIKDVDLRLKKLENIPAGLGVIDETCDFIQEQDQNLENIGLSDDKNIQDAYFTKIDFGGCLDRRGSRKINSFKINIFGKDSKINDDGYQRERIETQIKLALFTKELLSIDAKKCFLTEDDCEDALEYIGIRNQSLLQQLEQNAKFIIEQNISIANIYQDVIQFLMEHDRKYLEEKQLQKIIDSVLEQTVLIIWKIFKEPEKSNQLEALSKKLANESKESLSPKILEMIRKIVSKIHYKAVDDIVKNPMLSYSGGVKALENARRQVYPLMHLAKLTPKENAKQMGCIHYNHQLFYQKIKKEKLTFHERNKGIIRFGSAMFSGAGLLSAIGLALVVNFIPIVGQVISLGMLIGIGVGLVVGGATMGAGVSAGVCLAIEKSQSPPVSPFPKNSHATIKAKLPHVPSMPPIKYMPRAVTGTTLLQPQIPEPVQQKVSFTERSAFRPGAG